MKITRHIFETYVSMIEGSVGSNMFRHFWADFDEERRDTMQDGWTSCAFFVSSVLTIFKAIDGPHSTVISTEEALEKTGWQKVTEPEAGDVLVWEPRQATSEDPEMDHIGFYVGDEMAVSTSWRARTPVKHDYMYRDGAQRAITAIYRGKSLMPDNIKTIDD